MITTDVSRAEFTSNGSSDDYVFNNGTVDIPVKEDSHIKVYVTDTGTITATNSTDKFTNVTVNGVANTAHGHTSGDIIKFGGTLPVGIVANTNYYVRDIVGTTFKVELSVGGGVVNITTNGSSLTWTRVTTKTLGTHYTVAISTSNVATVSWMSGKRPLNNVKFYFAREVPYSQTTDLLNNSLIEAESLENQLDLIVNQIQQVKNTTGRVLKYSDNLLSTDATDISATLDVDASSRANKSLKFDAQGNLGVSIINFDDSQDYVLESKSYATESPAVVNHYTGTVATAQTGVYSAKEHAVGTPPDGSAKEWATTNTNAVAGGLYSAKQYAANAAASATTANDTKIATEAILDAFDDRYLGSFADGSEPSVDNDGNTLLDGALYFNTTGDVIKVYDLGTTTWKQITPLGASQTNIDILTTKYDGSTSAGSGTNLNIAQVNTVALNVANVNKVGVIDANVTKVANIDGNVTKVATLGNNGVDVTTVSNIGTDGADVSTVAAINTEIGRIGTSAYSHATTGHIKIVSDGLSNVDNFALRYRISANEGALVGSDDEGDLYYNSTDNLLRYYNGTSWLLLGQTEAQTIVTADNSATAMAIALG
jgi:hypothetical protein